ncbi:MAG TPA: hypothetical protein PK867_31440 [Pirellulales bacterium]|nr:hypothetical protein [Pirellulales bacterium]
MADEVVPADAQPRWWKGNLHTHTLWSDGDDFPEMVAEWYRTHGYQFLALSDHNILAQGMRWMKESDITKRGGEGVVAKYLQRFGRSWVEMRGDGNEREVRLKPLDEFRALVEERGRFLMIPAEEISDKAEGVPVHINASNVKESLQPLGGQTVREAIENNLRNVEDQARRAGREILVHLNHPNFGWAITAEDLAHVVLERHFEVYNGHPGVNQLGDDIHPAVDRLWDIANTIRLAHLHAPPLYGIATDDSHHYHDKANGARPGRGWLMVRATHLTPEQIVKAIRSGDCYASSGVTLTEVRYDRDRRKLELQIQPAGNAHFVTRFIGTLRGVDPTARLAAEPTGPTSSPKAKNSLRVTGDYSDQIGQVLKSVEGLAPAYELTGEELYVRAVVTSSEPPRDPSFAGQKQQAWTQPVGWE